MKKTKKLLAIILSAIMILSSIVTAGAVSVRRDDTVTDDSGKCGDSLTYKYNAKEKRLTISGTGNMYDYDSGEKCPWYEYRYKIGRIDIENGVKSIGEYAFSGLNFLSFVNIPDSVTDIGRTAFTDCLYLRNLTLPGTLKGDFTLSFIGCEYLELVVFGNGITKLGSNVITDAESLKSVVIPKSVTEIADDAFESCNSLIFIYGYPGTVVQRYARFNEMTFISVQDESGSCGEAVNYSFDCITGKLTISGTGDITSTPWELYKICIKSVEIKPGVTGIIEFFEYIYLESVTIPEGVTSIAKRAFYHCERLTSIVIPDSVTEIGNAAFQRCTNLTSVVLGKGIKTISFAMFELSGLTSLVIPDGVTEIEARAFTSCTSLEKLVVPDSVSKISIDSVFKDCINLTIYGNLGSYIEYFAIKNYLNFAYIEDMPIDTDSEVKPTDTDTTTDSEVKPTDTDTVTDSDTSTDTTDTDEPKDGLGDVDGDNEITMLDVVMLQKEIAKLIDLNIAEQLRADVNKDNKNTMEDVVLIQKYIAKLINKF